MSFADVPILALDDDVALTHGEYLFFVDFEEPVLQHKGFFIFLSVVKTSNELDVFFQSAYSPHLELTAQDYNTSKVTFEGVGQARARRRNVIAISDYGHYIYGMSSSFYCGSAKINYCRKIGTAVEMIMNRMGISHSHVVFIGSSAGADGALHSATYMNHPVTVIAVNPWILLHKVKQLRDYHLNAFGDFPEEELLKRYGAQLSAIVRYQESSTMPVLRLLLNRNDKTCFNPGMSFVSTCGRKFKRLCVDIYAGPQQHVRPPKDEYLRKIEETRMLGYEELLKQNIICQYENTEGNDIFEKIEGILLSGKGQRAEFLRDFGALAIACGKRGSAERLLRAALKERPNGEWIKRLLEQALAAK
jgi:hypothetical protein